MSGDESWSAEGHSSIGGRQGQVLRPDDRRLSIYGGGSNGQGKVKDRTRDRRFSSNRKGPTGAGRVKNPETDRRLAANNRFRLAQEQWDGNTP